MVPNALSSHQDSTAMDCSSSSPLPFGPQVVPVCEHSPPETITQRALSQTAAGMAPATITSKARHLKSDKIVDAWDKIGVLTNEMTTSLMTKQADMVAKRYRNGGSSSSRGCETHHSQEEQTSFKKQRLEGSDSSSSLVSSSSNDEEAQSSPASVSPITLPDGNWSESLTRQVDRMARMSKLIMEIEYCHRLLRKEMVETQKDLCS